MPKKINSVILSQNCLDLIVEYCKSADITEAAFSRKFEKHNRWVSELRRGRSMPTREEAARMCVLLQTTPEEILTEEADIELVRGLIEQEREKGIKKDPVPKDEAVSQEKQLLLDMIDGLSDEQKELLALSKKMSDDELKRFIAAMKAMLGESM